MGLLGDNKTLILRWDLDASQVKRGMKELEGGVKSFENFVGNSFKRAAVTTVALAGAAVYAGAKFESAMVRVASNANASASEFEDLKQAAQKMGATTVFSASQSADALYNLTSAGLSSGAAIATLGSTLNLAAAEGVDLAFSASTMTNAMAQFSLGTGEADRVANAMSATVSASNQVLSDLGEALKYSGSQASLSNVSFEETLGLLGVMANQGQKGGIGGMLVANAMRAITSETKALKPYLKGVNLETDGFAATLDKLKANGLTATEVTKLLGRESSGLAILMKAGGDEVRKMTERVTDTTDATRKAAAQMDTLEGDFKTLMSVAEATGISLFDAFKPELRETVQLVSGVVSDLNDWIVLNEESIRSWTKNGLEVAQSAAGALVNNLPLLGGAVAGLATAFVSLKIGGVVSGLVSAVKVAGGLRKAFIALGVVIQANPIGLIAGVLSLATAAFVTHKLSVDRATTAYDDAKAALKSYRDEVSGIVSAEQAQQELDNLKLSAKVRETILEQQKEELAISTAFLNGSNELSRSLQQQGGIAAATANTMAEQAKVMRDETVPAMQAGIDAETLSLTIEKGKIALLEKRIKILNEVLGKQEEIVDAESGGGGGGGDTAAYRTMIEEYKIGQESLQNRKVYYEARLEQLVSAGKGETEEAAKTQIRIFELEKEIGSQRTAQSVVDEYTLGQSKLAAQQEFYQAKLEAMRLAGETETAEYGALQVRIMDLDTKIHEEKLTAEWERQQMLFDVGAYFAQQSLTAAETVGQALINGEANTGAILATLRRQFLSTMLSDFISSQQRQLSLSIVAAAKERAVAVTAERAKTAAMAGGVTARTALTIQENTVKAAGQAGDIGKVTSGVAAFYAGLGPIGIPLAALTIAGFIGLISKIGSGKAWGGLITGPGGDRSDGILTPTSRGEFVIQAPSTRSLGVDRLNYANKTGRWPSTGGGGGLSPTIIVNADVVNVERRVRRFFEREEGYDLLVELLDKREHERSF